MIDNSLSLEISQKFTLISFTIDTVIVTPNMNASVNITITASNGRLFNRVAYLDGAVYTAWSTDDYLYKYIQDNISIIFDC